MAKHGRKKLRRFELIELWVSRLIIWFVVLLVLFPIISIITSSFQKGDAFTTATGLLPDPRFFTFDNYKTLFKEGRFPIWIRNTFLIGAAVGILQVALTVTASYAFSRLKFWGRRNGIRTLLLLQMMPAFVSLAAIQFVLFKLGMANLFGFLLVTTGASAWSIWLLKGYIDSIPRDLDEAAKVDGCNDWEVFVKIILPLSVPMIAILFLFAFMGIFNEFIMSSAILKDPNDWLLAQGLKSFSANAYSTNWGKLSAAVVLTCVPLASIWVFAQKYVQSGLTRGAVKG
jgi:arabinogalactan oligomer/maltooligosaccharide transport system permease protein